MPWSSSLSATVSPLYPWQQAAWGQLLQRQQRGRLPHGLILYGAEGEGISTFIQWLAQGLLCTTPTAPLTPCGRCSDCHLFTTASHPGLILPDQRESESSTTLGVEAIRQIISRTQLGQSHGNQVILLAQAAEMTTAAANALLKSLEEPPANTFYLLQSRDLYPLPLTIRSRCQLIDLTTTTAEPEQLLHWLAERLPQVARLELEQLLILAQGQPLAAEQLHHEQRLPLWQSFIREVAASWSGRAQVGALVPQWLQQGVPLVEWLYLLAYLLTRHHYGLISTGQRALISGSITALTPIPLVALQRLVVLLQKRQRQWQMQQMHGLQLQALLLDWLAQQQGNYHDRSKITRGNALPHD